MKEFLLQRMIIYEKEWVSSRLNSYERLLSLVPIRITGAFITGLCLRMYVSVTNEPATKASIVRFGYQKSAIATSR